MSHDVIEGFLGRLITDAQFRDEFFLAPERAARDYQPTLSSAELGVLANLDRISIEVFADSLDPRIVRAIAPRPFSD